MKGYLFVVWAASAMAAFGCATPPVPAGDRPAVLVVPGGQFEHEVLVRGPGRQDVLRGVLAFTSSASFSLKAFTPFGLDLFELGRSQGKFHYKTADALKGKLPLEAMARDVWRIYFASCPAAGACLFDGANLIQQSDSQGRLKERVFRDESGREATVVYRDWKVMQDILHPETIELSSGDWGLRIHAVGFAKPAAVSSTKR